MGVVVDPQDLDFHAVIVLTIQVLQQLVTLLQPQLSMGYVQT